MSENQTRKKTLTISKGIKKKIDPKSFGKESKNSFSIQKKKSNFGFKKNFKNDINNLNPVKKNLSRKECLLLPIRALLKIIKQRNV